MLLLYKIDRVTFIERDYRIDNIDNIVLIIQAITRRRFILKHFDLNLNDKRELFLLKDVLLEESPDNIKRYFHIYLNRDFDEMKEKAKHLTTEQYIRRVLNL